MNKEIYKTDSSAQLNGSSTRPRKTRGLAEHSFVNDEEDGQGGGVQYHRAPLRGGTLERPQRLYNFSIMNKPSNGNNASQAYLDANDPGTTLHSTTELRRHEPKSCSSSFARETNLADTNKRAASGSLYEGGSGSISPPCQWEQHQYEEPHLIIDYFTANNQRQRGSHFGAATNNSRHDPHSKLSYLRRAESTTTVIPPSLLFAKSIKQTSYLKQTNKANEQTTTTGGFDKDENSQMLASMLSMISKNTNNDSNTTKHNSPLLLYKDRAYHDDALYAPIIDGAFNQMNNGAEPSLMTGGSSSAETFQLGSGGTTNLDESGGSKPANPGIASQSSSVMMHTYANPFLAYPADSSEDTTGPIIPDINTLRPSQNSLSSTMPPPTLNSESSTSKHLLLPSVWVNRLRTYFSLDSSKSKAVSVSKHRCSWRLSTFGLSGVVILMLLIIVMLTTARFFTSNETPKHADKTKVPCIIVEESESSSDRANLSPQPFEGSDSLVSEQLGSSFSSHPPSMLNCAKSPFLRNPLYYKELRLAHHAQADPMYRMPITTRLQPFGSWSLWFSLVDAAFVEFEFFLPSATRLSLVVNKNEPPSFTRFEILQTIAEDVLATGPRDLAMLLRHEFNEPSLVAMKYSHWFEHGSWYVTIINDQDRVVPVFVNVTTPDTMSNDSNNKTIECSNNCHANGHCHLGKCQCFPGFVGTDCADNVCPVVCSGHGKYLEGGCRCEDGWKGRECSLTDNQCEVPDCNANGLCREGACRCRQGFKGEHCQLIDCEDPHCSGRGVCLEGVCICHSPWSGANCTQLDDRLSAYLPKCSSNGVYDLESGQCQCLPNYAGVDCSQPSCSLNCGEHGRCEADRCVCHDGWSGSSCEHRRCDARCLEHGQCAPNGTCLCAIGWMGEHCSLDGCPRMCSKHGQCVRVALVEQLQIASHAQGQDKQGWACHCDPGWGGHDCSTPQETNCMDEMDNDNDGLVDCADSECCGHEQCHQSLMCITSPDPLEVLARQRVSASLATFFERVHFLIEDSSVQSYAQKDAFVPKRASVIRGQVVGKELQPLIGIRVSVSSDPQFGFTLSRSDGWFDMLVNGGGLITLQFQRNPFHTMKKSLHVAWNELTVLANPIVMTTLPSNGKRSPSLPFHSSPSLKYFSALQSDFDHFTSLSLTTKLNQTSCAQHDRDHVHPQLETFDLSQSERLTMNSGVECHHDCVLAESQIVHSTIAIPDTRVKLVHSSQSSSGHYSLLHLRLTSSTVPPTLRFILLRIIIEGQRFEKIFEAAPDQEYTFAWNKHNVYKQRMYGSSLAKVYTGYIYDRCTATPHWHVLEHRMAAFPLEVTEMGGWNIHIHHRYSVPDAVFQRGDGQTIDFKSQNFDLVAQRVSGEKLQARPYACREDCHGIVASRARFFSLNALTSSPDGSVFVGDANLVRRVSPEGNVYTVYRFPSHSSRQSYEYYLAFNAFDQHLYISDPQRYQIIKLAISDNAVVEQPEAEVVVGSGERCLPHSKNLCGDERQAHEVRLIHPKGLAFALDGSMFFADGNVIRVLDSTGIVRRVVGLWSRHQWVTPSPCNAHQVPASEIKLYWPTSVSINPLDGSVYFLDNNVVFQLSHDMKVTIVAGNPSFCAGEDEQQHKPKAKLDKQHQCSSSRLVPAKQLHGQEIQLGSIAFGLAGQLYLADTGRPGENRIFRMIEGGTRLEQIAGLSSLASSNCSSERCSGAGECGGGGGGGGGGGACATLLGDYARKDAQQQYEGESMAVHTKLSSITGLTVTGDGTLYVADDGQLQLYTLRSYQPRLDDQLEIKIISSSLKQLYILNKHGQHMSTRSMVSGRTLYTFQYNQDNSFAHLTSLHDWLGNRVSLGRDVSGRVHTLVTPVTRSYQVSYTSPAPSSLLSSISSVNQSRTLIDYYPTGGLVRSKLDMTHGRVVHYSYDHWGQALRVSRSNGATYSLATRSLPHWHRHIQVSSTQPFLEENELMSVQMITQPRSITHIELTQQMTTISLSHEQQGRTLLVNASLSPHSKWMACIGASESGLSHSLISTQAHLFPIVSYFSVQSWLGHNNRNNTGTSHEAIAMNYHLKFKSSTIHGVEKTLHQANGVADVDDHNIRIELDWKTNRQLYYNRSRSMLAIAFDETLGLPQTFASNSLESYNFKYNKAGLLTNDGLNGFQFVYDNEQRLIKTNRPDGVVLLYRYNSSISQRLPASVMINNEKIYKFEFDGGLVRTIVTPKGGRFQLGRVIVLGHTKHYICPPHASGNDNYAAGLNKTSLLDCYLVYYDARQRLSMRVWPSNTGKVVYRYGLKSSMIRDIGQEDSTITIDQILHGSGAVEHWFSRSNGQMVKAISKQGKAQFGTIYKYARDGQTLKHQACFFEHVEHVSKLSYIYQYDGRERIRSIQAKLGSISLPALELSYSSLTGLVESFGAFRYFERTSNTSLVGDGTILYYRSYDAHQKIVHQSVTIAEKEVVRIDYSYDSRGRLVHSKSFMAHLGGNKMRLQNYSYNLHGQLSEVLDRGEHWRCGYDLEDNLVSLLYSGNRIDIELDSAGRIKNLKKGPQQLSPGQSQGHTPYVMDARGFVIQRGNEHLVWNNLGQLVRVSRSNGYEISYIYDHHGRLVIRRDHRQRNSTRQYFYGLPSRPHLVTHFVDSAEGRVMALVYDDRDDSLVMVKVNNEYFHIVCDHAKSPIVVLDHRGQVVKEVHRSPWGHTLFDSNPAFHLPVDFHAALHDSVSNLVYFGSAKRVYDTVVGRWLTPDHSWMVQANIFENPGHLHSYQFGDPVNVRNKPHKTIMSNRQITQTLHDQTLEMFGGKKATLASKMFQTSSPFQSQSLLSLQFALDRLEHRYMLQDDYFSLLSSEDWNTVSQSSDLIWLRNSMFFQAILVGLGPQNGNTVQVLSSSYSNPQLAQLVSAVLNGSVLLPHHLVISGVDHFYLVNERRVSDTELVHIKHLQRMLNLTVQEIQSDADNSKHIVEVVIFLEGVRLNVRYDTTLDDEKRRVVELANRVALVHKLNMERLDIFHNRPGLSANWSEDMRRFMLDHHPSTLPVSGPHLLPFGVDHFHSQPEARLLEDCSNVILKPK